MVHPQLTGQATTQNKLLQQTNPRQTRLPHQRRKNKPQNIQRNNLGIEQFRAKLRESEIYSLLDVDEVVFETDGKFTIIKRKEGNESYLLINNGEIAEKVLEECGYDTDWLNQQLTDLGYDEIDKIFCAEYTPERGFYIIVHGRQHS